MSLYGLGNGYQKLVDDSENRAVSSAILSVAEGKRLIAKAVAKMHMVRRAMRKGMVIICKGTTNSYIAEELTGEKITHGSYVLGRIYPNENANKLGAVHQMDELILIDGIPAENISLEKAVTMLSPGDVVIKGANLLDYRNKLAGVCIGSPTSGTAGTIMPYVIARRAELIIPIGLEKLIAGDLNDIASRLNNSTERLKDTPAMFTISGHIVTEIEAIRQFADVEVYETACGGIGGQEGGRWLAVEGAKHQVLKAMKAVEEIYGEKPFVE
ncbi:MAG: hypothetical protein ACIAQZ_14110 [Sedimentisphaeraceae bacterium JB056]